MESVLHFALGQAFLVGGAYWLSKKIGWPAALAVLAMFEGAISVLYGLLTAHRKPEFTGPWHAPERSD